MAGRIHQKLLTSSSRKSTPPSTYCMLYSRLSLHNSPNFQPQTNRNVIGPRLAWHNLFLPVSRHESSCLLFCGCEMYMCQESPLWD